MEGSFGNPRAVEKEIAGTFLGGKSKIVRSKFGIVAAVLWPTKTAFHIAEIAGVQEKTARRWLSGEFEPPGIVIAAVIIEITKRS